MVCLISFSNTLAKQRAGLLNRKFVYLVIILPDRLDLFRFTGRSRPFAKICPMGR